MSGTPFDLKGLVNPSVSTTSPMISAVYLVLVCMGSSLAHYFVTDEAGRARAAPIDIQSSIVHLH